MPSRGYYLAVFVGQCRCVHILPKGCIKSWCWSSPFSLFYTGAYCRYFSLANWPLLPWLGALARDCVHAASRHTHPHLPFICNNKGLLLTFIGWLFIIGISHTHMVVPKLSITKTLKQNITMATSALRWLWTSLAFTFENLKKKSFKEHTASLQRRLRVASAVIAGEKFKNVYWGFLVRSIISKNAMNSYYLWPCCLVSWEKVENGCAR